MKKVVIIGAGPAGITAGYELLKNRDNSQESYEVVILEESEDIGGISKTVKHNNNRMDIGGHRFFSKDKRVVKWWEEILPKQGKPSFDDKILKREPPKLTKGGPDPEKTDRVMLTRNRISRIYYKNKFFDYPIKININTIKNMGFITTCLAGVSYVRSTIFKRKENSLEDFYINRFGEKLYSMFFEGYTEKLWGRHPREISADWGAQRVKGLSFKAIIKDIVNKTVLRKGDKEVETSLIEKFSYPKFGPGQLWETAAEEIENMGGVINKGCKVVKLNKEGNSLNEVVYIKDGKEQSIKADYVLSSMPLKDLIGSMAEVPGEIKKIAYGLPYRDFVTVGLCVKKLKIKNQTNIKTLQNIVPDCWIYVQDKNVKLGRIQIFNNWSPYMVAEPEKTVFIGLEYFCSEGDKYWAMDKEQWVDFAIKELIKMVSFLILLILN
ncbi:MAG: NAD(P)-binding protein, partial [Clostridia bacterium]|nr:NAD(P)-binding protein [Clostridia bacterium]